MSAQEAIGTTTSQAAILPKQPEVNIGTAGHVDHGKCLALDEYVILGGRLLTGREIIASLHSEAELLSRVDNGTIYRLKRNEVVSIGDDYNPTGARSLLYIQDYDGPMAQITTDSGRRISVTPVHPLMVNRKGVISWVKAKDLTPEDHVAFLSKVPEFRSQDFPDPLMFLGQRYRTVSFTEHVHLARITDGFSRFGVLSPAEIDKVRVLGRKSTRAFSRLSKIGETDLRSILDGRKSPSRLQMFKISRALHGLQLDRLGPDQVVVETRKGRWSCTRMRVPDLSEDLMKWFAFVWAEGSSSNTRLAVAQSIQLEMLQAFHRITEREFGLRFKKVNDVDYHLNSRPLVDLLAAKFGYRAGNESVSSIADWVLGVPPSLKSAFLSWFFTLDGEFNGRTGQIMISQANPRNIVVLGYLLQSLGVVPRFSQTKHVTMKGPKIYARLMISGRANLKAFANLIGFEDSRIQNRLVAYLSKVKAESKETDFSLPIDTKTLREMMDSSGLLREGFPGSPISNSKNSLWYKAYEATKRTGRISRSKLLQLVDAAESSLLLMERSLREMDGSSSSLLDLMRLLKLSQETAAKEIGLTRKRLMTRLRRRDNSLIELQSVIRRIAKQDIETASAILVQLRRLGASPLEFDRVRSIQWERYDGVIFDLTVPDHANFVAGTGAIVAHNTTVTQAITGVWASAHSEELKRGITIKVGYADAAFYRCPQTPPPAAFSTSPKCPVCGRETQLLRAVSFVDCPGHESLMTNMLAGAFLMDGALLVIAANEPVPKPQTREHLQALQMLGMKKIVIAQNKIDLVTDEEAKKNYEQIVSFVEKTVAADAPIIPISAQQRLNIDALIEALEDVIPTPRRDASADSLMYVVRSFDVNKPGTEIGGLSGGVLGGSLVRGELKVGDEIELKPGMVDERSGKFVPVVTKVSALQTGAGAGEKVGPGGLVAVGTHLDPTYTKGDQMVGSVIGKPGTLPPTWEHVTLEANLFETAVGLAELVKVERIRPGENLRLNLGTAFSQAVVTSARGDVIEVDLKKPVAIEAGMRAALSRRIVERWRLIGSGLLK